MIDDRARCVNLDWLEVYVHEDVERYPCNANYFISQGYVVHQREYGTRTYREMFTIDDERGEPFLEVRRNPFSEHGRDGGLFPPNSCHVRLCNNTCYRDDAVSALRDFLARHNYTFKKIYRLDIALDFERFDEGDDPARFIERFMRGKYSKINQANIAAHGRDEWAGRIWNSISWGNPKSMVSTKMYCKTLELMQVHDKPYIKWCWFQYGLVDDPVTMTKRGSDGEVYKPAIWRVEFSIKSSAQRWFIIERSDGKHNKIAMPHLLSMYDTKERMMQVYASLAAHYFRFKYYEEGIRKDRCRDKVLFKFSPRDQYFKVDRLASHSAKTKPLERFILLLKNFKALQCHPDVIKACDLLITLLEKQILRAMTDNTIDYKQLQALRMVIKERSEGIKDRTIAQRLQELIELMQTNEGFW